MSKFSDRTSSGTTTLTEVLVSADEIHLRSLCYSSVIFHQSQIFNDLCCFELNTFSTKLTLKFDLPFSHKSLFQSVSRSDRKCLGTYYFIVIFPIVLIFSHLSVFTESPPTRFIRQPVASEVELMNGSKIFLCETNGSPTLSYTWFKDGIQYSTGTPLVLKNLKKNHAGVYQCKARNNHGAVLSHKATLEVACK
jgi:hypothetical protein